MPTMSGGRRNMAGSAAVSRVAAIESGSASGAKQSRPRQRRPPNPSAARRRPNPTWAMLIKRVYEVDPLACPQCGGAMELIAFIEPPQGAVIEKILRHCGLWLASQPRPPPAEDDAVHDPVREADGEGDSSDRPREVTYVDMDTFWATF